MDCKIIPKIFFLIIFFISTHLNAIEFKGKFLQGHYIIGITDPSSKIIIDKKEVKVSKDGYFAFGLDRDRKYDVIIELKKGEKTQKIIKKVKKRNYKKKLKKIFRLKLLKLKDYLTFNEILIKN